MLDDDAPTAISGYRHKVAFFKTPGDLWMLKGTSPNVCLTIAPNYRLQNESAAAESTGNVITRRFAGPLLRRYCDRMVTTKKKTSPTSSTAGAAKATARRLICQGRAIGCSAPNDRADRDVTRRADDVTRRAADDRGRRPDDVQRRYFPAGFRRAGCGPLQEGQSNTLLRLPWHVGRVYSGDSLIGIPVTDGTQSLVTVSLSQNKEDGASGRNDVQQPKFRFPVLYGNINSRAMMASSSGEKKRFGQVEHERGIINDSRKEEEAGSSSESRTPCSSLFQPCSELSLQSSLVVCQLHPFKTRSGPSAAKSPYPVTRRGVNTTPDNGAGTIPADQEYPANGEGEEISGIPPVSSSQSIAWHETYSKPSVQTTSETGARFLRKDRCVGRNTICPAEDDVRQAKDTTPHLQS